MKKIIATALSILVGAFGYTIVDSAIENRVTSLESEVVELREEFSKQHPPYSEKETVKKPSVTKVITTRKKTTTNRVDLSQPLAVGSYLIEKDSSVHKFLIRENLYGRFEYVSSNNYEPVSLISRPLETTEAFTRVYGEDPYVAEYFVYINDSSAQITDITEEVSYKYSYDKDYSSVSEPINKTIIQITVLCTGYTDAALAGKKIILSTDLNLDRFDDPYYNREIISNTVNPDGSFEYKVIYSASYASRLDNYAFTHIQITK